MLGNLFAFYGDLLTEKQKDVFRLYCHQDLSLGEISQDLNISRQAVYDSINRVEKLLVSYESKLGLMERFDKSQNRLKTLISEVKIMRRLVEEGAQKKTLLAELDRIHNWAVADVE